MLHLSWFTWLHSFFANVYYVVLKLEEWIHQQYCPRLFLLLFVYELQQYCCETFVWLCRGCINPYWPFHRHSLESIAHVVGNEMNLNLLQLPEFSPSLRRLIKGRLNHVFQPKLTYKIVGTIYCYFWRPTSCVVANLYSIYLV